MTDIACRRLIRMLGLLSLALSLLVGCGGSDGGGREATSRVSQMMLNIQPPQPIGPIRSSHPAATVTSRQITATIDRLQVDVHVPDLGDVITAHVPNLQSGTAMVELTVPQGPGRRIDVRAFNVADAVLYEGTTQVDLMAEVEDVTIDLEPVLSLNTLIQANINAAAGAMLSANPNAGILSGLTVTIAPGAFANDTSFTLGTRNNAGLLPQLPPDVMPVGPVLGFDAMGEPLIGEASITMPYQATGAAPRQLDIPEQALGSSAFLFYVLTPGSMDWQPAGNAMIDTVAQTITVPLTAFGSGIIGQIMNTPPTVTAAAFVFPEDTVGTIQINVQEPDANQSHTFAITVPPTQGTAVVSAAGLVTYTPMPNVNGIDTLTVSVTDSGMPPQTINFALPITITPVNDPPTAQNGSLSTAEDAAAMGTLQATDLEGGSLTFTIVSQAGQGMVSLSDPATGAYTYTPNPNANGTDAFTFSASDGAGNSNVATVTVTITPINDPPDALNNSLATTEDVNLTGALMANDVDGDPVTFSMITQGSQGSVVIDNPSTGAFTYTPNPDVNGSDAFTFQVNDGTVNSNPATITVNITPVDDPPAAQNDSVSTNEDTMVNITVLSNDTEVDGETLTINSVTQGSQGTVSHNGTVVTYTPDPDTHGADAFSYTVQDTQGNTDNANVSVTITPVNDPPVAFDRALASIDGAPNPGTLLGIDVDGDPLTFSIDTPPGIGATAVITDAMQGTYLFDSGTSLPPPNSFTYKVNDGTVDSNIATVFTDTPLLPLDFVYTSGVGGTQDDTGTAIAGFGDGRVVVVGVFEGTMILGKGRVNETQLMSVGKQDMFIAKYFADGSLAWARQVGSTEDDEATGVITMPDDSVMVTGYFQLTAIFGVGEPNETPLTSVGMRDLFIARYDPNGMLIWAEQAGGSGDDMSLDMAVTAGQQAGAVITGSFHNTATFDAGQPGEVMLTSAGMRDIFVAQYDNMGGLSWAKSAGGSGDDESRAIATTTNNEVLITGAFRNTATFGASEPGETMLTSSGMGDILTAAYDPMGMLVWAVPAGGSGEDTGTGITSLSNGEVVVTGAFENTATFIDSEMTTMNLASAGSSDIFLVRFDSDAVLLTAVRAGGSGVDEAQSVVSLPDDTLVAVGAFENTATFGPTELNETMLTSSGLEDMFIAHYNFDGMLFGAKRAGSTGDDEAADVMSLPNGHPIVTGHFEGAVTFGLGEPFETVLTSEGGEDAFISRFSWVPIPR